MLQLFLYTNEKVTNTAALFVIKHGNNLNILRQANDNINQGTSIQWDNTEQ